jgi:hypothetical protein
MNLVLTTIYVIHFAYQLVALIPITKQGKLGCAWASPYDIVGSALTAVDVALTTQISGAKMGFRVRLVIQAIIYSLRFICVAVYWFKVDKFHLVRARSFRDDFDLDENPDTGTVEGYSSTAEGCDTGEESHEKHTPIDSENTTLPSETDILENKELKGIIPPSTQTIQPSPLYQPVRPERSSKPERLPLSEQSTDSPTRPSTRLPHRRASVSDTTTENSASQLGSEWRPVGSRAYYNPLTGQIVTMKESHGRTLKRAAPTLPKGL